MLKRFGFLAGLLPLIFLSCGTDQKQMKLKVAATPVPHAQMLQFAKVILEKQGIDLQIIVVDDYNIPNRALADKEVDANFFQHIPFMDEQIKDFHYPIENLVKVEIEPMGLYSKKITALNQLKEGDVVAIPNDPSNEARALLLLQKEGLLELNTTDSFQMTVLNINSNPYNLHFIEIDAAMLPRALPDVSLCAINTNYALSASLNPTKDALALESIDSPYANIIAIRIADKNRTDLASLKEVMTSQEMAEFILKTYQGAVLPAFNITN